MSVQRSPLTPLVDGLLSCAARSTSLLSEVVQQNSEATVRSDVRLTPPLHPPIRG